MKFLSVAIVVASTFGLLFTSEARAELLFNPGFEDLDGVAGPGDGWGSFGSAGFNSFFGANAHASLFMDNPGNFGGVFQAGIASSPGTQYTFSLTDVRIEDNAAANARFGLEYYAADDTTKVGETIVPISLSPTGNGLSFTVEGTAVAGTAFARPIILFDNVTSTASGQENLFIFDASLTTIPEPSTAIMITTMGMFAMTRRKK